MSKKQKDAKRKEHLMTKADMDAFRCQLKLKRTILLPGIPAEELNQEIQSGCRMGEKPIRACSHDQAGAANP